MELTPYVGMSSLVVFAFGVREALVGFSGPEERKMYHFLPLANRVKLRLNIPFKNYVQEVQEVTP
jgi:hypothetical protein